MKNSYLLSKIDNFYKISGELDYPKKMHEQLNAWAQSVYCYKIYKIIEGLIASNKISQKNINNVNLFKLFLSQKIQQETKNPDYFYLNFDDISYFTEKEKKLIKENKIKAQFLFINGNNNAAFNAKENKIYIYQDVPYKFSQDSVNDILSDISVAIRHELQHVLQFYGKHIKGKIIGIPSDTMSQNNYKDMPEELKRIEFYPNLSDTIDTFNECLDIFPSNIHNEIFDVMIAKKDFQSLKNKILKIIDDNKFSNQNEKQIILKKYNNLLGKIKRSNDYAITMSKFQPQKHLKYVKEFYKKFNYFL